MAWSAPLAASTTWTMPVVGPVAVRYSLQAYLVPSGDTQARNTGSQRETARSYVPRLAGSAVNVPPGSRTNPPWPAVPSAVRPSTGASPLATGSRQLGGAVWDAAGVPPPGGPGDAPGPGLPDAWAAGEALELGAGPHAAMTRQPSRG